MNKNKLNNLPELTCGIHTICILINGVIPKTYSIQVQRCINEHSTTVSSSSDEIITRLILNLNKWDKWCSTLQEFETNLWLFLSEIGVSAYQMVRVDFALDYKDDNYNELHKLNKCICLLAAITYSMDNRYESYDPLTLVHLTTRVQNEYIELENYNKAIESDYKNTVFNRLELRSKSLSQKKVCYENIAKLIQDWSKRLDKCYAQFERLQSNCNDCLVDKWQQEQSNKFKGLSEFIRKYQANIYTSSQLIDFYERLGLTNPKGSAKSFTRRSRIEFISQRELASYISILKQAMWKFNIIQKGAIMVPKSLKRKTA